MQILSHMCLPHNNLYLIMFSLAFLPGQFSGWTHPLPLATIPEGQKQPSTHSCIQLGGLSLLSQVMGQADPHVSWILPLVHAWAKEREKVNVYSKITDKNEIDDKTIFVKFLTRVDTPNYGKQDYFFKKLIYLWGKMFYELGYLQYNPVNFSKNLHTFMSMEVGSKIKWGNF